MAIVRATLAKSVDNVISYIYPKSVADIIEYDNSAHSSTVLTMSTQDKLDELHNGIATLDSSVTNNFLNYYTKADIDDIFYTPVKIDSFTSSVTKAEIGSTGTTTLSYSVTRMTKITSLTVAGVAQSNPDTSSLVGSKTFTGSQSVSYASGSASVTSQSFSMSVKDTATSNHAATTATKSITINYYYPIFYGVLDSATINASQVVGLTRYLGTSNKGTGSYTFNAGSTNGYLWFCCQSGSSVSFAVGGFSGGFESPTTVSGININGISTSYKCYRSTNRQTSNTTVVVS